MELVFSIPMDNESEHNLSIILSDLAYMCNHVRDDGLFTDCPISAKCPFVNKKDCEEITRDDWKPYVTIKY